MRKFTTMLAAAAMAVVVASGATAQDEKKKGRPEGGRTGMMGGGGFSVFTMIGTNKVLQEELKISDEQKTKLEAVSKASGEKLTEARKGFTRDATDEQRKEFGEKMAKATEETKKAVLEVLNSDQKKRVEQINYQMMGTRAFTNKDVITALKISDEQQEKIKTISETAQKDTRELGSGFRPGGGAPSEEDRKKMEENQKKIQAIRKDAEEKIAATLSDDQKKQWKEMVGEKFDTAKLFQGFGERRRDN